MKRLFPLYVCLTTLLALLMGCTTGLPATASPSATVAPLPLTSSPTATPRPSTTPAVSPTAERARATFGTIVSAVTHVPTPTSYPPPLLATATVASEGIPISVAEAEGSAYPRLDPAPTPPDTFANAAGDAARRCVPVEGSDTRGIRSGGFAAGPFNYFLDSCRQHGAAKVWWVPEYSLRGIEIVVRAVRLDTPSGTVRQQVRGANADFFPSLVTLPSGGTWLLIATGGPNWGCFILTLPS